MTHHARVALVGPQQTGQHRDRCGLSRPVRAEQAEDLALPYLEADTLDSLSLAKGFVKVQNLDCQHIVHSLLQFRARARVIIFPTPFYAKLLLQFDRLCDRPYEFYPEKPNFHPRFPRTPTL
jgi:hypothetical protein